MALDLICLIIDPDADTQQTLPQALWPEIQFTTADYTSSLVTAFQMLVDSNYNICFIHGSFAEDLDSFFRDMKRLGRDKTCVFVQTWDTLAQNFDKSWAIELGFTGVISKAITPEERKLLKELLRVEFHHQEVTRKIKDVSEAVHFVVKELDRVARERQRGNQEHFDTMIRNFVVMLAEFDEEVMNEYFSLLGERAQSTSSFEAKKVKIPAEVLARKLPHLTEDKYCGRSLRVWESLLKRYGLPNKPPLSQSAAPSSEPQSANQDEESNQEHPASLETPEK